MPSINEIVERELRGPHAARWRDATVQAARESLGRFACNQLDVDKPAVGMEWLRLDDPQQRMHAIERDSQFFPRIAELLEEVIGPIRVAIQAEGYGKQSRSSIRPRLQAVFPALMTSPTSVSLLLASPFSENWSFVGDELARRLTAIYDAAPADARPPEWRVMNYLILAEYFRQCVLPEARLVAQDLDIATRGLLSIRGTLICTANRVSSAGVGDDGLHVSAFSGGVQLHHAKLSVLLDSVSEQALMTASGNGVMRRLAGHHHFSSITMPGGGRLFAGLAQSARNLSYHRHEYSLISYMAVAGIEQLLRSCARQQNVNDLRAGGLPASVGSWVDKLDCDSGVRDQVRALFGSDAANVRNRLMHSGFLLAETNHLLDNIALGSPRRYADAAGRDRPHSPRNIAHLALECLRDLDADIQRRNPLVDQDFSWSQRWCLTPSELTLGRQVHCELIPLPGGSTLEVAVEWVKHLSRYFSAVMPGLGQFFRLSYLGFIQGFTSDSFTLLHGLALVFEAIYRLTVHLLGLPILTSTSSGGSWYFQYRMLDFDGLQGPEHVNALTDYLEPGERDVAREILSLAVQCRNALAHGAVVQFDEPTNLGMAHLMLKATQLLVGAGEHHMTREGAWYRWRKLHPDQHGFDQEDWLAAEEEVLAKIARLGDPYKG